MKKLLILLLLFAAPVHAGSLIVGEVQDAYFESEAGTNRDEFMRFIGNYVSGTRDAWGYHMMKMNHESLTRKGLPYTEATAGPMNKLITDCMPKSTKLIMMVLGTDEVKYNTEVSQYIWEKLTGCWATATDAAIKEQQKERT